MTIAILAAALVLASPPGLVPTPIGTGPRYRPPPAPRAIQEGRPVGSLACSRAGARFGVHLELFAYGRVVIVPAGIGVAARGLGCTYPARTLTPTGVVEVRRGVRLTVGDVFRLWGQPLDRNRLAGFRSARPLEAFVGGARWTGDARAIPLRRHAEIVLELGGYVPPHPSFLFPGGL